MKHYVSFTSILKALFRGELKIEELDSPETVLCFGCAKEHALGNYIPQEVSWMDRGNVSVFSLEGCDPAKLTPESLLVWNRFRLTIERADREGRVRYRIGNYPAYCMARIAEGVPVWWLGWRKWADYEYELGDQPLIKE